MALDCTICNGDDGCGRGSLGQAQSGCGKARVELRGVKRETQAGPPSAADDKSVQRKRRRLVSSMCDAVKHRFVQAGDVGAGIEELIVVR